MGGFAAGCRLKIFPDSLDFRIAETKTVDIIKGDRREQLTQGNLKMNMQAIGTMVISDDSFTTRMGQVCDITTSRWGTFHVVIIEGKFEQVGHIDEQGTRGIGWKVATPAEIARHQRQQA